MKNFRKPFFIFLNITVISFLNTGLLAYASKVKSFSASEVYNKFQGVRQGISEDREKAIKKIKNYIENEQYTHAMVDLNKILDENPDDPRVYIMSAKLLRKTYQFDEAEEMAKKALRYDYKNSGAYLELGYIYLDKASFSANDSNADNTLEIQQDYFVKSFDHFFIAAQYDPQNPYPHIALAEAYYANSQKQRAKDEILKAKELAFSRPEAFYEIGQYYYKTNEPQKALKYIEKSISSGRDKNYKAFYYAGRIAEQGGNIKEAQKLYLYTLKLKPDMLEAQKHLDALIKLSYKEKIAEESAPKDLFANVNSDINMIMKADHYLMIDEYTKARDIYIAILQKNPQNNDAAAGLAELYYSKWKEGFSISKNFTQDAIYLLKSEPSKKNEISFLKFQLINETKMPEKIRQDLIKLSISETFEFYDLLNEIRAEFLLGNYEESHNKLYKLLNMKLSNYEKFKVLKQLSYDHNYYEAAIVLDELKKTYYHNEEIEPVENRLMTKFSVVEEKIDKAAVYWEEEKYNKSLSLYKEIMGYFPTYKPAYWHYALAMEEMGNYNEAYENLNKYYKLYKLYPDKSAEITEKEIRERIRKIYAKTKEKIKQRADKINKGGFNVKNNNQ